MAKGIRVSEKHGVNPSLLKCFWCGQDKGVALLGKLKGDAEAPREMCLDYDFCDNCVERIGEGIALLEVSTEPVTEGQPAISKHGPAQLYPTGSWVAVTEEAIRRMFTEEQADNIIQHRRALVEVGFVDKLMSDVEEAEAEGQDEEE